jgi:Dolichyl-phosphate-mannose-protein mannosyltransferase
VAAPAQPSPRATLIALATFALVFVTLAVSSYTRKSSVWDEPIHLTDGYVSLAQHDVRVDPEHPPFLRMWAALPLVWQHVKPFDLTAIDRTDPDRWAWTLFSSCERFLYSQNDADLMLYPARFMIVVLGVGLGVLLFFWAKDWLGFWPAVVALACYTVEPDIVAHASLVTTDFGFACFMFGALYFLWRTSRAPRAWNVAGLVVFCCLAVVSKFSAVVLAAIVVLLLGFAAVRRKALTPKTAAGILALLVASAWLAIWAVYGFKYAPSASPAWLYDFQSDLQVKAEVPKLASVVTWIDHHHLFPNAFSQGFLFGQAKAQVRPGYLMGTISDRGWWYYFPFAFLVKTPVALLLLMAGGLALAVVRWRRTGPDDVVFVLLPIAVYLAAAMASRLNIGNRHLLPIYPLALLLVALAASELLASRARLGRYALTGLVGIAALEFGANYPDNLAFFNVLVGGPDHGSEYLVDSNLDWGQDLKPLKAWMDAHGVPHINLAYFGTAYPPYYGIDATLLPGSEFFQQSPNVQLPGYVAISATILRGVYLGERERAFYRPFTNMTPVANVGHSIFIYWVDQPWW